MPTPATVAVGLSDWPLGQLPAATLTLNRADPGPPLDPAEAIRAALEQPFGLDAPMRRAVTPDDRVTIVLDEGLPHVAVLLAGVIEHLGSAGIKPEAVTVVVPPGGNPNPAWIDELPDEFCDVKLEVHDLENRDRLAYVATTRGGKRVYLNRTLVESQFVVALTGRRFDPTFGYAGAESAIYPALSEPEAVASVVGQFRNRPTRSGNVRLFGPLVKKTPTPQSEAIEIAWLLGSPFFVQVIEGPGDTIRSIVAGLPDTSAEGARRQEEAWHATVSGQPDLVVAAISGDPGRVRFLDLAQAAANAARVVRPGGRVAILTAAAPPLEEGADLIRGTEEADDVPSLLRKRKPDDWPAAELWATAARSARLFLASRLSDETAEELFATPLASATELQRLILAAESPLIVPDAHKTALEHE